MLKRIPVWLLLFLSCCLVSGVWLYFKLQNFDLCLYSTDLFSHLQLSRGWLMGRPFMYENAYAQHDKIHSFYLDPLLGIFTYYWGAYGLFAGHLCIILAGALLISFLYKGIADKQQKRLLAMLLLVFYMGPISFLVWDNPGYAFHPEVLYMPLSVFLCFGLFNKRKWAIAISALLLGLCKEDGIVLLACLMLGWVLMQQDNWLPQNRKKLIIKLGVILGASILVFVAGLWLLAYKNGYHGSRAGEVLDKINKQPKDIAVHFYRVLLDDYFTQMMPVALFLLLFIRPRLIIIYLVLLIPILIVQLYSASFYIPARQFGLLWPPRLGMLWGYTLAFLLMATLSGNTSPFLARIKYSYPAMIVLAVVFVLYQRAGNEDYRINYDRCWLDRSSLDDYKGMQAVRKLTRHLPDTIDVQSHNRFFCLFPYNNVVWDDIPENRWKKPELILSRWDSAAVAGQEYTKPYRRMKVGNFTIFVKPGVKLDGE